MSVYVKFSLEKFPAVDVDGSTVASGTGIIRDPSTDSCIRWLYFSLGKIRVADDELSIAANNRVDIIHKTGNITWLAILWIIRETATKS